MGEIGHFCSFRRFRDVLGHHPSRFPMCLVFRFFQLWLQFGIMEVPWLSTELSVKFSHSDDSTLDLTFSFLCLAIARDEGVVNYWHGLWLSHFIFSGLLIALSSLVIYLQGSTQYSNNYIILLSFDLSTFIPSSVGCLNHCTGQYISCHSYIIPSYHSWKLLLVNLGA